MIVAGNPIKKGSIFDENSLALLRTGDYGLNGQNWDNLIGKKIKKILWN